MELIGVWYALEGGYLCCWPCSWGIFFGRSGFILWERGGLRRSFEEGAGGVEIRPSALGLSAFLGASFEGVFGVRNCATKEGGIGFCALPPKYSVFVARIRRWDWGIRPP